jgi:tRNA(Ile)-lysidine synthase
MIRVESSLIPDGGFCVGVSGGVDSIACLHLLHRIYKNKASACHINHGYQSINEDMMNSVSSFCEDHKIPLVKIIRHGEDLITSNVEARLRDFRLGAFKTLQSDIVLCHHLNDAVESYLMNALRGCPEYKPIQEITPLDGVPFKLIRPFLTTPKINIQRYAENNGLMKYVVEDPSNADNRFRRNHIRNQILPMLDNFGLEKIVRKKFYNKTLK